jgi:5'-3' exonuclease
MSPGEAVTWKGQRTFVRSLETIIRADRTPLECAVLECNRFTSVAELVPGHDVSRTQGTDHGIRERRNESTLSTTTKPVAVQPTEPVPSPCNVLAVDFLNVLVRAYHAGKPNETHAVRSLFQTVANAIRKIKPAHVVFAMDGGHDLRSELLPEYKAHRAESEPLLKSQKELAERALHIAGFQCIRIDGWEADDVLASLAMAFSDTVIVSSDKDLLVMPSLADRCRVYHPWGEGCFATAEEKLEIPAHLVTDYLALCGDPSDGIPGVKGIGPKTAATLLQEYDSLENILAAATLGQIKAKATCQNLKEQREAALLCRRVVELNSRLPLPELADWRPATGWQSRLADVRLGAVAAIVDAIKDQRFARDSGERQGVSPPSDTPPIAATPVTRMADTQPLAVERFTLDIESLMVLAEDVAWTTPEASAVTCWHAGRKGKLRNAENPWRVGTWEHVAWAQGCDGVPLCVSLRDDRPQRHDPVAEATPTQKSGSLF